MWTNRINNIVEYSSILGISNSENWIEFPIQEKQELNTRKIWKTDKKRRLLWLWLCWCRIISYSQRRLQPTICNRMLLRTSWCLMEVPVFVIFKTRRHFQKFNYYNHVLEYLVISSFRAEFCFDHLLVCSLFTLSGKYMSDKI